MTSVAGHRVAERPFDPATRFMATVDETPDGMRLSVKGAPEVVLPRCDARDAQEWEPHVHALARQGLRVLALADASSSDVDEPRLRALGLVAFRDPLRPTASKAVAALRGAGIQVVMVTGDHLETARRVAQEVGLDAARAVDGSALAPIAGPARRDLLAEAHVVARVEPHTKVDLVEAHRAKGHVVAMTGDGVNDAPALRRADIGVALAGEGATDVAREAADLVVTDNDLSVLAAAVAEGRRIYRNMATVVAYLLTGNMSEVIVVLLGLALFPEFAVTLLPVQLLFINLVTDGLPALALGLDRPATDLLAAAPRRREERILGPRRFAVLVGRGFIVALAVLATAWWVRSRGAPSATVQTQLFVTLLLAHLVLAYVSRAERATLERGWWRSRPLLAAIAGSIVLVALVTLVPSLRAALDVQSLPAAGWALAAAATAGSVVVLDGVRWWNRRRRRPAGP